MKRSKKYLNCSVARWSISRLVHSRRQIFFRPDRLVLVFIRCSKHIIQCTYHTIQYKHMSMNEKNTYKKESIID